MDALPSSPPGPLAGLRVVDCSTVLAGPYCTMLLADLGADVVKVEPPEGDATRGWGPPWQVAPDDGGPDLAPTAAYYMAANRNKRSIRLDLRQPAGREVLGRLLDKADVLVENFRPGGFERLGFDDAALRRRNAALVHLSITGFGRTGPLANRPGYDFLVQAQAGLMSITGFPDDEGGAPTKVGVAIADLATGLFGAIGVLAALLRRGASGVHALGREDRSGEDAAGQRVDVSIFESTLALLINQAQNLFVSGIAPGRRGNAHPNIVPYETFATSDGQIAIGVGSERQWRRLCELLGRPAIASDGRFATNGDRVLNRDALREVLEACFAAEPSEAWLGRLEAAEVPAAPINDLAAAFSEPQVDALGTLVDLEHRLLGRVRQVATPISFSDTPASVRTPPPALGEHADEILAELGYGPAEVARLRADRVV